ncbi:cation:proton antiporter [Microlunatus sp. Gsoil 973]|uniref:cation:proton antiporter domain-containing protein n=1 Tax=Microlunatus sp. Gsoil 973 TaxID=2672569 RepID=UPI0012B4EED7|nr:cation:proton antiporter [Microlunatus sp. Gsoil 973]QGN34109.1 sodium:proton exchanger [Microlunatus sp. Gsoil 973]
MSDAVGFGVAVLVVSGAIIAAIFGGKVSAWLRVPAPALFLIAAAAVALLLPPVGQTGRQWGESIVSVALVFILFDGGMHIGWRRFRSAAGSIAWIGVAGTAVSAAALATCAHFLFGLGWQPSLLLGAALSPTDPAVVFSVLGGSEIAGRTGTILEGESGANDPVGIALLTSLVAATGSGLDALGSGLLEFALQMVVGAAVGLVGGFGLTVLARRVRLGNQAMHAVLIAASAAALYGIGSALHGSGFLAVFIAGILLGDVRVPYKREIEQFSSGLAGLAEIVAFIVLGLNIDLREAVHPRDLLVGLSIGLILIFLIRPILVGLLTLPIKLERGERAFVLFAGLKGAVPILLGLFILDSRRPEDDLVFAVIFVVVLMSVVLQGGLVPFLADRFGVPMHQNPPRPWSLDVRFAEEPQGLQRHVIAAGSRADGRTVSELGIGDRGWISMISRAGRHLPIRNSTRLQAGDVVLTQVDEDVSLADLLDPPDS